MLSTTAEGEAAVTPAMGRPLPEEGEVPALHLSEAPPYPLQMNWNENVNRHVHLEEPAFMELTCGLIEFLEHCLANAAILESTHGPSPLRTQYSTTGQQSPTNRARLVVQLKRTPDGTLDIPQEGRDVRSLHDLTTDLATGGAQSGPATSLILANGLSMQGAV